MSNQRTEKKLLLALFDGDPIPSTAYIDRWIAAGKTGEPEDYMNSIERAVWQSEGGPLCAHVEGGRYCNKPAPHLWRGAVTIPLCEEHFAAYPARAQAADAEFQSLIDAEREPDIISPAQAEAIARLISASKAALKSLDYLQRNPERGYGALHDWQSTPAREELRAALVAVGALEGEDPR